MSLGERIRLQFEAHLKAKRDQNAWEEYWKTEGRAAGHAEGRAAGHAEGRAEGRAEGHAEGEWSSYISLIRKKVIKGMNASEIAEVLEMELPLIQELVRLINSNPGVTDEELVAQWLCKK